MGLKNVINEVETEKITLKLEKNWRKMEKKITQKNIGKN